MINCTSKRSKVKVSLTNAADPKYVLREGPVWGPYFIRFLLGQVEGLDAKRTLVDSMSWAPLIFDKQTEYNTHT